MLAGDSAVHKQSTNNTSVQVDTGGITMDASSWHLAFRHYCSHSHTDTMMPYQVRRPERISNCCLYDFLIWEFCTEILVPVFLTQLCLETVRSVFDYLVSKVVYEAANDGSEGCCGFRVQECALC